jgi:CelD/BcsL family acetyltransferase involved in cellulose biosynthesis
MILLLRLAAWAAGQGLGALDLGKGPARYKTQLRSYGVGLAEGSVELPGWARLRRSTFRTFASWADTKPRAHPARLTVRAVRRVLRYQRFR